MLGVMMNSGGILSGRSIRNAVEAGDINITPFDPERINPASYDLTLGSQVAIYDDTTISQFVGPSRLQEDGVKVSLVPGSRVRSHHWDSQINPECYIKGDSAYLDSARKNEVSKFEMENTGFMLMPGVGYLMHTAEKVHTDKYVPILDGKSSIGRLFCFVHITAGFGDPGFDGQYTLEVVVLQPLIVYPGMKFCQIRFHTLVGEVDSYKEKGNYKGALAEGPIPSQSWKMFNGQK